MKDIESINRELKRKELFKIGKAYDEFIFKTINKKGDIDFIDKEIDIFRIVFDDIKYHGTEFNISSDETQTLEFNIWNMDSYDNELVRTFYIERADILELY